ncbi:PARPBP [Branchiostoma lanceolatum]|uniref:PCNA-interacting partner n=1 Tax=Branchiostoma lanceolatum TaxID=7740 RepID=A0A8J9ZE12_BRALA|nr:PARPBP [Branchiostoma lanceolatum]
MENMTGGVFYLENVDTENCGVFLNAVVKQLVGNNTQDEKQLCVIGNPAHNTDISLNHPVLSLTDVYLTWQRSLGLRKNTRETVLTPDDQLVALQLCMAELNSQKIGAFEAQASDVLEVVNHLIQDKLGNLATTGGSTHRDDYQLIREAFDKFLDQCNVSDIADVFLRVKEKFQKDPDSEERCRNCSKYILLELPQTQMETEMLKLLVDNKSVTVVTMETSLDTSFSQSVESADVRLTNQETDLTELLEKRNSHSPTVLTGSSATESYIRKVFQSYLTLLLNCRDEIALARAINIPDRDLDHRAFTELKRMTRKKNMPMCQTAVSFVMKKRLGGKSYAPSQDNPLLQHIKGLSEFVTLLQKMQTIVEECTDSRSALGRLLTVLKNVLMRSKDLTLRRSSVEVVAVTMMEEAGRLADQLSNGRTDTASPKRSPGSGGSVYGRDVSRFIQLYLDRQAGRPSVGHVVEVLSDVYTSQSTPVRIPSLVSQFRSPDPETEKSREDTPLLQRTMQRMKELNNKKLAVPRYQSDCTWAMPAVSVSPLNNKEEIYVDYSPVSHNDITTKAPPTNILQAEENLECDEAAKKRKRGKDLINKILESVDDQENVNLDGQPQTKNPGKRKLKDVGIASSQPPSKKSKKPAATTKSKKKIAPLLTGQKKMTSFFRM